MNGVTMAITEGQRFDMQVGLRKAMGDQVANILMEHLPPAGWSDVARQSDIGRLERRVDSVVYGLWALGGLMTTGFFGVFAVLFTKF
jgi:hypothetical protein